MTKEKVKHKKTDKFLEQITKLENSLKDLEDKNLRLQADLINYRIRKEKETSDLLKYANEDLILELLPILDNFERALAIQDETNKQFMEGFKLVYNSVLKTLENYGLKKIESLNQEFNPSYHQAISLEEVENSSNMVVEVLREGYILKEKVIRPAMVKVSK